MSQSIRSWRALPAELKRARLANAMTQTELAERLGVDQASVSRWENGRQTPDRQIQTRLRDLLFRGRTLADARLAHFISNSTAMITLINMRGQYVAASPAFRKIWDIEKPFQSYLTPSLTMAWTMAASVGLFRGEIASMRVPAEALTPDRTVVPTLANWHLRNTADGEPLLLGEITLPSPELYRQASEEGIIVTPLDALL